MIDDTIEEMHNQAGSAQRPDVELQERVGRSIDALRYADVAADTNTERELHRQLQEQALSGKHGFEHLSPDVQQAIVQAEALLKDAAELGVSYKDIVNVRHGSTEYAEPNEDD